MDARTTFPTAHSAAIEAIRQDAMHERDAKIGRWFRNLFTAIVEYPSRRRVMDELAMLSDRELADIGLNRADIRHVFTMTDSRPAAQTQGATVHTLPVAAKAATVNPVMVQVRSDRIAA
jgi:uncharacterized protein YjiS (DUF1127 family)